MPWARTSAATELPFCALKAAMGCLTQGELAADIVLQSQSWVEGDFRAHKGYVRSSSEANTFQDQEILLGLLDLPLDILQTIIREVTHTNDLTALALTCSDLHSLVIPHIYARFDIVWPDSNAATDGRIGVDALTYGLSTLVMSPNVFGEAQCHGVSCIHRKCDSSTPHQQDSVLPRHRTRRGNHFAQYVRKFSLGNGPEDWIREYLMTKESGKMLGTLAALAIGRMWNLESFHWDMPTGVLRDVWLALSSLASCDTSRQCRLENVWIRWHDSRDTTSVATNPSTRVPALAVGVSPLRDRSAPPFISRFNSPKDFPTFSILPPLKSLSVLDIDERSCIGEISNLIQRSSGCLQELRIGLARHAENEAWARPRGQMSSTPSAGLHVSESTQDEGLLALLFSHSVRKYMMSDRNHGSVQECSSSMNGGSMTNTLQGGIFERTKSRPQTCSIAVIQEVEQVAKLFAAHGIDDSQQPALTELTHRLDNSDRASTQATGYMLPMTNSRNTCIRDGSHALKLQTLELENIYLSKQILTSHIDWCSVKSLTLLGCHNTESVWRALRKRFAPTASNRHSISLLRDTPPTGGIVTKYGSEWKTKTMSREDYKLAITKIQTDTVSAGLLAFIKDTLAPDTLEVLFLQSCGSYTSTMTLEQIYKCAVRRHRASLRKLLIDSDPHLEGGTISSNWRRWCFNREILSCVIGGRMQLRELSLSLDHKDWHYCLQRLPEAPNLRSLHVTHIANYIHGQVEPREAAQQIVDVVALRPELQLCFVGIHQKCFEILETKAETTTLSNRHSDLNVLAPSSSSLHDDETTDDQSSSDDEEIEHALDNVHAVESTLQDEMQSDSGSSSDENDLDSYSDETDEESVSSNQGKSVFKLREILFYDDKIAIFKARHAKL